MKIIHATECAASGTLSVIVSLAHELAAAGARQLVVYSERPETPANLTALFPRAWSSCAFRLRPVCT